MITVNRLGDVPLFKLFFNRFIEANCFKDGEQVEVIEYSAYQQALDKIAELEKKNEEFIKKIEELKHDINNENSLKLSSDIWLKEKISLLEQDLESEKRSHQITKDSSNDYIMELKLDNTKMISALKYYADFNNWELTDYEKDRIKRDDMELLEFNDRALNYFVGGKTARKALGEL